MAKRPYIRNRSRLTLVQFYMKFNERYCPPSWIDGPDHPIVVPPRRPRLPLPYPGWPGYIDPPKPLLDGTWFWSAVQHGYRVGRFTKDFTIPAGAKLEDYSLPELYAIKMAGIEFPGYTISDFPENFLPTVRTLTLNKKMDIYGKVVDPADLGNFPPSILPYIKVTGRLGNIFGFVIQDDPHDIPPGLAPFVSTFRRV